MRRTPIRPVSKRRRARDAGYQKARQAVYDRAGGKCEAWASPGCRGRAEQVHHRAGRVGADPHRLENLLAVCQPCHGYIEEHRTEAYEKGWLVRRNGGAA